MIRGKQRHHDVNDLQEYQQESGLRDSLQDLLFKAKKLSLAAWQRDSRVARLRESGLVYNGVSVGLYWP